MNVLLVTNDFPPRLGGIQTYLFEIYRRIAASGTGVTVLAPHCEGDAEFDAALPEGMRVVRRRQLVWPTRALAREIRELARTADVVAVGATLPMAAAVHGCGRPLAMHTHGFEIAWTRIPVTRPLVRRLLAPAALVTVITEYTRRALEQVTPDRVVQVRTGVDLDVFRPDRDGHLLRERYGLSGRPVVVVVSRLVRRKGVDALLRVMPELRKRVPGAALLIVGDGPDRPRLERIAAGLTLPLDAAVFAGSVPFEELPDAYAAGDVFAMPCRTRLGGLEVEGLGLVYLEAAATGRPVITGDSGGAPEAIIAGRTGLTVPGRSDAALLDALTQLLSDRDSARAMGARGRAFVESTHDWDTIAAGWLEELRRLSDAAG